jgi:hypothetical protein
MGELDPGAFQQVLGLLLVHSQRICPGINHLALRGQQGPWRGGVHREAGTSCDPAGRPMQVRRPRQGIPAVQQFHVVQDHGNRLGHLRDRRRQPRYHGGEDGDAGRGQGLEHSRSIGSTGSSATAI